VLVCVRACERVYVNRMLKRILGTKERNRRRIKKCIMRVIMRYLMTLTMKVGVLWDVAPCSLVAGSPAFRIEVLP
jgi:hypothetical protein